MDPAGCGLLPTSGSPCVAYRRLRITGAGMTREAELFLPQGYRTNHPASADRDGTPYWEDGLDHNDIRYQVPVYRLAAERARRLSPGLVMDIGCGSGDKLVEFFRTAPSRVVGVDQDSAISLAKSRFTGIEWLSGDLDSEQFWTVLTAYRPDLVICSDVIEHLIDPLGLLRRLRSAHLGIPDIFGSGQPTNSPGWSRPPGSRSSPSITCCPGGIHGP